jgi:hypothetical protein
MDSHMSIVLFNLSFCPSFFHSFFQLSFITSFNLTSFHLSLYLIIRFYSSFPLSYFLDRSSFYVLSHSSFYHVFTPDTNYNEKKYWHLSFQFSFDSMLYSYMAYWYLVPWPCVPERYVPVQSVPGRNVPWTIRPFDNLSLGRSVPWTIRPLDDPSPWKSVTMGMDDPSPIFFTKKCRGRIVTGTDRSGTHRRGTRYFS